LASRVNKTTKALNFVTHDIKAIILDYN